MWLRQCEVGKNSADINWQLDRPEFLQKIGLGSDIPPHRIVRLRRQGERYFTDGLGEVGRNRHLAILAACIFEWCRAFADRIVEKHDRVDGEIWCTATGFCEAGVTGAWTNIDTTLTGVETLDTTLRLAKGDTDAIADAIDVSCGWSMLEALVANAG
jgi:hypothetical protein